jgi:hypothetical protein
VTGGNWLALGFATQNTPNTLRNFTNAALGSGNTQGYANMVYRVDGDIDQFRGLGSGTQVAADDVLFTGSRTMTITLDFTPLGGYNGTTNFGTASFGANVGVGNTYEEFGSSVFTADAPIGSLLLSWAGNTAAGNVTGGGYSALTLTQIPEPAPPCSAVSACSHFSAAAVEPSRTTLYLPAALVPGRAQFFLP